MSLRGREGGRDSVWEWGRAASFASVGWLAGVDAQGAGRPPAIWRSRARATASVGSFPPGCAGPIAPRQHKLHGKQQDKQAAASLTSHALAQLPHLVRQVHVDLREAEAGGGRGG